MVSYPTFRASTPQLYLDVDRLKAKSMGVPLTDIFDTLQIYLGSLYVNDLNLFGRTYHVTAQADAPYRRQPEDILNFKARNSRGEMVPLGTLVQERNITGPDHIVRYDMYPAAEITGNPGPGVSSGDAIAHMEKTVREKLPASMGFEWTELTLQEILEGNTVILHFSAVRALCLPDAGGTLRKLVAAPGDHPDRADVPALCHPGRLGARHGQ